MPVRGSRQLYKIPTIKVGEEANGTGGREIVVKMKEPIAKYLGLTPMRWDDEALTGTFGGTGLNQNYKYVKRVGGYRAASFTIVAKRQFQITEIIRDNSGNYTNRNKNFRSLSIGFPRGVSVHEFLKWIGANAKANEIDHIVTPSGKSIPLGTPDSGGNT